MARFRTDELVGLLMYEVKEHGTDGIASTDDVMPAGAQYIRSEFGETDEKVVTDSVRWALIHMCDTLGVLERPYGKLDSKPAQRSNASWLQRNRPRQDTNQQLWRLSQLGNSIV